MSTTHRFRTALKWTAGAVGFAAGTYASYIGVTWLRYGHPKRPDTDDPHAFLQRFMPAYDGAERRDTAVAAPAGVPFVVACEADLMESPFIQPIFRARELAPGAQ